MDDLKQENAKVAEEQKADMRRHEQVPPTAKPVLIDAESLQKTLNGLTNMALVHEIALNKDFKLKKPERTGEENVSQDVQMVLDAKEKYWQRVDEILREKNIKDAKSIILDLIQMLRTMLHSTMLPHNVKLKSKIDLELDQGKVSNEIDNDAFDFEHYMAYILDTLVQLCCPIRDKEIAEIRTLDLPSQQVKKTIDLMENMNLDMANFIIEQSREHLVQNCVMYERNKFATYVELQYKIGTDPVEITRNWVKRHVIDDRPFVDAMAYAYLEALDWGDQQWPETLTLDQGRFPPISEEIRRVTLIGAMVAAVYDYARTQLIETPEDVNDFEKSKALLMKNFRLLNKLRDELNLLITCEEVSDARKFQEALERCCIQAVKVVDEHIVAEQGQGITTEQKERIMGMIRPLLDLNHPVRLLYYRRVKEWFLDVARSDVKDTIKFPPNLSMVGRLISTPITEMVHIANHNRAVFDVVYQEIFDGNCEPPKTFPIQLPPTSIPEEGQSENSQVQQQVVLDDGILNLLMKLQGLTDKTEVLKKFQQADIRIQQQDV